MSKEGRQAGMNAGMKEGAINHIKREGTKDGRKEGMKEGQQEGRGEAECRGRTTEWRHMWDVGMVLEKEMGWFWKKRAEGQGKTKKEWFSFIAKAAEHCLDVAEFDWWTPFVFGQFYDIFG